MPLPFNHCYVYGNIILQHTTCVLTSLLLTSKDGVFCVCMCMCAYVRHVEVKPIDIAAVAV
jgi:hypothetical protein